AGRVTVLRDITAAKEIEAMKAEFAEKITSKLEDPLSSVRQTVDLLLDETAGPLTEDQKQFLFVARNDAGRVERILGDILNLSQLGSGNLKLDLEPVRVGELIETIIADFKTHAESKKINLSAKTGQRLHDLKADLTRSKQILSCLIDNAIKFSPNNEKVIVEAANHDEGILFTVTDTGIGIPAEDKEKIFETWDAQQTSAGGSRQGSGLGLPLAKKLVEAHGRRMWVESKPGRGSKFSFILPKN
ncbi:MAG: HAMP domain-containing histidine kinase, partial [Candidatus Omnitrophica bacterium]|nr:HAMP domain-containing histidine kinase [Candidatus Omnitrophota bacterium]